MRFKIETIKTIKIADKTYESTLTVSDEKFYFNSGQYIWVENPFGKKAFSIASSSANQSEIKIIYRYENGDFKDYLVREKTNYLYVSRGKGFLRFPNISFRNTTYIVGGVGIAPIISFIETAKDKKLKTNFNLININTSKEKQFYLDKLGNYENLLIDYSKDKAISFAIKDKSANFVVLGNQFFVDIVNNYLINSGISSSQISFDENYPSVYELDLLSQS